MGGKRKKNGEIQLSPSSYLFPERFILRGQDISRVYITRGCSWREPLFALFTDIYLQRHVSLFFISIFKMCVFKSGHILEIITFFVGDICAVIVVFKSTLIWII